MGINIAEYLVIPDEAEKITRLHVAEARRMIEQQAAKNEFTPKWVADAKL